MRIAFIDEANPEPNEQNSPDNRFLIVGTTIIDASRALELSDKIEKIREDHGFKRVDSLKFSPNDRPDHLSNDAFISAKRSVLEAAKDCEVRVILYCALHSIIDKNGMDKYLNWATDAKLTKLQQFS
ncbi:DUF3800 domain-containing protein [Tropicimonas sediminicola]|uniref:DUF3800 domain-containing protein n=1 Tax=Tropicimonas sediminicola TaxID=1031541 RepID=UPI001131715A|nr:DUF3800 domain-containing protein [Tropicimonas sediminicola]